MRNIFHAIGVLTICLAGTCFGQYKNTHTSLCSLRGKVAEGDRINVRVSGVYEGGMGDRGLAIGTLDDPACPDQTAWVEIVLQSKHNGKKLSRLLDQSSRAHVAFEGEFYGPPVPDPKLPEAIGKTYHPGWGHLAAFKTKLVVHAILAVRSAPETGAEP